MIERALIEFSFHVYKMAILKKQQRKTEIKSEQVSVL